MSTFDSLKSGTDIRAVAMGDEALLTPQIAERIGRAFAEWIDRRAVAISRDDQDAFAQASHQKACAAIKAGHFAAEISPYAVKLRVPDLKTGEVIVKDFLAETDEGPRPDSSLERLARLKMPLVPKYLLSSFALVFFAIILTSLEFIP